MMEEAVWTIPSREEAEAYTAAYLAAQEAYYESLECGDEPPKEET